MEKSNLITKKLEDKLAPLPPFITQTQQLITETPQTMPLQVVVNEFAEI